MFNSKNGAILKKLWTHEVLLSGLFSVKKLGLDGTDGKVRSRLDETVCAALYWPLQLCHMWTKWLPLGVK